MIACKPISLSLAHFTVLDADPIALIDAGFVGGFDAVGLRLVPPPGAPAVAPVVGDAAMIRRIRERLNTTGMRLLDVEALWLLPDMDDASLGPVLDVAAELGARHLLVCGDDPEPARMAANLSAVCEAAHERGLRVMLEFLPYTHLRGLHQTQELLRSVEPVDAGILVDAVHLSRSHGHPADLSRYDPGLFSVAHLCDVPECHPAASGLRDEARNERLFPGEGGLWLDQFVQAFPPETVFAIEAPSRRHAVLPIRDRARMAGDAGRALLTRNGRRVPEARD